MKLGKLQQVDIRQIWHHEQYDFSQWLSQKENIQILENELDITFADIKKEVYVGPYRCDLVATDEATGDTIIIENQLEPTNHDHLGKIITYTAGLDAKTIIWIVASAKEEHRAAIEWLNNNTSEDIGFFLIELHAYRINDSAPAPMFNVIEKPNQFSKQSKTTLTQNQYEILNFWNTFNDVVKERGKPFSVRKATPAHWYNVAIGSSDAHISINLVNQRNCIVIELYIRDNKNLYDSLYNSKATIEDELGFHLEWCRLDDKKACRIKRTVNGLDFDNHSNYHELMNEIIDIVLKMRDVFSSYL